MNKYFDFKNNVIKYTDVLAYYFYQPLAALITYKLRKTNITPNQITIISLIFGIIGGMSIYFDYKLMAVIILNISFILDCVDGQLARLKNMQSFFGMWLDNISDRIVEGVVYIALSINFENCKLICVTLFLSMLYSYMSDLIIYQNRNYKQLSFLEKIFFAPVYLLNRSFIIVFLSLLIYFHSIIYFLVFLYIYGIIFRVYREVK